MLFVSWEHLYDQHSVLFCGIFPAEHLRQHWAARGCASHVPSTLFLCLCHAGGRPSASGQPRICLSSVPESKAVPIRSVFTPAFPQAAFLSSFPTRSLMKVTTLHIPAGEEQRAASFPVPVREDGFDRLQRCPLLSMQNCPGKALSLFCSMHAGKMILVPFFLILNCSL